MVKKEVLKHCLKNAYDFNGSVNSKAVLGMILKENPELKKDVPAVMKEIEQAVKEISKLNKEEIKKKLKEIAPELLREKKEEKKVEGPLKSLPNAESGKFVVRIAPSPSGPLHIGHAYGSSLNYEYAKMYNGKLILRIEDTNPENIYPDAYRMIEEDLRWLTENNVAEVIVQSLRLGIYYDHAEKLVQLGKAYVCTCDSDLWRKQKAEGIACPCRNLDVKKNQLRYAKMFNGYAEGEAVLRLKTDIKHNNPAMRDFSIMRINEHTHPKTGKEQRVWPLMIFSVAIDDHELGITHVLNGKDHADNAIKEALIMEYLGWKPPQYKHWGMINFTGFELSTSKTRLAIEQGHYHGWDDIRIPFLCGLRKRGYQPGAFRKYALEIGLSLNDKTVSMEEFWKNINAFNRELIEKNANRYFFVHDAVKVKIMGAPSTEAKIKLHPDYPERGERSLHTTGEVYLNEEDIANLSEKKVHRLMDYCNFEVVDNKYKFVSENYEEYRNSENKGMILHWLPDDKNVVVEVLMEDGKELLGLGEKEMLNIKEGSIVQLERFAYCTLDKKEKNRLKFIYLHK